MVADVRPKLAEKIKWYRERAGLSQRALADAIKADKATVWRAEQGDSWPDYKTLESMAGVFGVELEALFAWGSPSASDALAVLARELDARPSARDPLTDRFARILEAEGGRIAADLWVQGVERRLSPAGKETSDRKRKLPEEGK